MPIAIFRNKTKNPKKTDKNSKKPAYTVKAYRLILIFALLLLCTRIGLGSFFTSASDITVANVAAAVNNERVTRNIAPLIYNTKLAAAADYKANDMIDRKYFSHTDPDGNYIWGKITAEGYTPYTILGENLAINFTDTEGLISAWIASPEHRANILNTNFVDQGLGVAFGNTDEGEYSSSVANTFGAQPTAAQKAQANTTTKTTTTQTTTTTPAKTATPVVTTPPATIPAQPATPINPSSPTPPSSKGVTTTTTTTTTTQTTTANSNASKPYQKVLFDQTKLLVSSSIVNDKLDLNVFIPVSGSAQTVNATVLDNTVALTQKNGGYTGDILFEEYTNIQPYTLVINATDTKGVQSALNYSLANIELPSDQNPKSFGNIIQKVERPDLYNVFKYIVIIFGALFMLFLIADTFHLTGKKIPRLDSGKGSNLIVLLLMISTLLLVTWWH